MSGALYLASRSPRRAALLRQLGVAFEIIDVEVDEGARDGETAANYTRRVAGLKAASARARLGAGAAVLAADTTVGIDGMLLGKPRDPAEAAAMIARLGGRWHDVVSAVVLLDRSAREHVAVVATRVEFCALAPATVRAYAASGEPYDKAGGYAIQGLGGALVRRIEGSYSAVVGLPLAETRELLERAGIAHGLSGARP